MAVSHPFLSAGSGLRKALRHHRRELKGVSPLRASCRLGFSQAQKRLVFLIRELICVLRANTPTEIRRDVSALQNVYCFATYD